MSTTVCRCQQLLYCDGDGVYECQKSTRTVCHCGEVMSGVKSMRVCHIRKICDECDIRMCMTETTEDLTPSTDPPKSLKGREILSRIFLAPWRQTENWAD